MADGSNRPLDATTRTRFIGVYSGRRVIKNVSDSQIGMVWPPELIDAIIACDQRDKD